MLSVIDFIHTNRDRYVAELKPLLAIPRSARCRSTPTTSADARAGWATK